MRVESSPDIVDTGFSCLQFLIHRGRHVVKRRVKSIAIVERQVAPEGLPDLSILGEGVAVKHLGLHRMEERLDKGVVRDLAGPVHALSDTQFRDALLECPGGILNASIRVEDQTRSRPAVVHRVVQCSECEFDVFAPSEAPTHDSATALVHDDRQVSIDGTDFKVGDVAYPHAVRLRDRQVELAIGDEREVLLQLPIGVADGGHACFDAMRPHDTSNPVLAHTAALTIERPVHAWTAIGAATVAVNVLNLLAQIRVRLCTLARSALLPAIVACARHVIHPAHQGNFVFGPVCFDELEDFRF